MTADHVISNDETYGFKGEWNALVVKDVFTQFRYFYPSARQDAALVHVNISRSQMITLEFSILTILAKLQLR